MNLNVNTISHLLRSGNFWSEEFMPVGLWDNSAIIATCDPNFKTPEIGIPCIIVRAEKRDLMKLYQEAFQVKELPTQATLTEMPSSMSDLQIPNLPEESLSVSEQIPTEEPAFIPVEVGAISLDFSALTNLENAPKMVEPPKPPVEEYEEESTKRFTVSQEVHTVALENKIQPDSTNVIPMPSTNQPATQAATTTLTSDWNLQAFLKSFDKVMFLEWKGLYLEASKWLGNWEINPAATKKIDVSGNSIFKIPLKSTYPYHGYVVGNPINDSFFQNFNGGKTPEHISVFPVYTNEAFAGEIVCITTKAKGEKVNLADFESYLHKENKAA